jgi:hypothetical protein
MKPPVQRLESIPAIDGGFVVSVPIPAAMKAHFEAAYWREHLDGQIECRYGCAENALRSAAPELQALGIAAARECWERDKRGLRECRWRSLEPFQLQFSPDALDRWERVGKAIGISSMKLLQAALACRYRDSMEYAAFERVSRLLGIASGSVIPMPAAR